MVGKTQLTGFNARLRSGKHFLDLEVLHISYAG
jgi:hypothetical protein